MFSSRRWQCGLGILTVALIVGACSGDGASLEGSSDADGEQPSGTTLGSGGDEETTTTASEATSDDADATPLVTLPVGRLVFDSNRGEDIDLYLLEPESAEPIQLTSDEGSDRLGQFTPDGAAVLFHTDRGQGPDSPTGLRRFDLYRLDLVTGEQTHLLGSRTFNSGPTMSPDGSALAFGSDASGAMHIYLAGPDASSPVQVTDENASNSGPGWSPDGTEIIYSTRPDDNWDIWVMNADGSDRRPLIEGPDDELAGAWSPDGTRVAFHSNREGSRDLFVFDVESGQTTPLTTGPADDGYASWSPDGEYLAFDSDRDGRDSDIYLLTLADGSVGRLTDDPARDAFPDWGP